MENGRVVGGDRGPGGAARPRAGTAQNRLRFLADASAVLAESLDVDRTLARVASLAVPTLGDWCTIHLVGDEGVVLAVAAHKDPAMAALHREAQERYPTDLDASGGVGAVIRTGEPTWHAEVTDEVLATIARDEEHLRLLRRLGFGSVVTFPLAARGRVFGTLSVATHRVGGLDADVVETAQDLARRASVAIDNARLHEELVRARDAAAFQAALLSTQAEAGLEGMLVVAPDGRMLSYNQRFAELWRFDEALMARGSDEEALARAVEQVADPESFMARVRELYAHPRAARDEVVLRDGRVLDRFGAPLTAEGETLGYAWYFRDVTDHIRAERQLAWAAAQSEMLARTLQRSLLPPALPTIPGVELAARYHPAGSGTEVGGDFYDVFRTGGGTWGVALGDVCGKGAEAATVTALVRYTVRAAAVAVPSPAGALELLHAAMLRAVADGGPDLFATVVLARLRPRAGRVHARLSLGGHPQPFVRRASGVVVRVGRPGSLLGTLPEVAVADSSCTLGPGDVMVLVTDGILEARRGRDLFGDERLAALLASLTDPKVEEVASAVEAAALEHAGGSPRDDLAVVVIAPSAQGG